MLSDPAQRLWLSAALMTVLAAGALSAYFIPKLLLNKKTSDFRTASAGTVPEFFTLSQQMLLSRSFGTEAYLLYARSHFIISSGI